LIAGGGQVAERKVKTLVEFGARVYVVSPDLTKALKGMVKSRKIAWFNRAITYSDIKGKDIIVAATSDAATNRKISRWSRKQSALVNVVDNAKLSSFISPAVFHANGAVIAVYTHGKAPALSRDLKNFLKENQHEFLSYRNRLQKRAH